MSKRKNNNTALMCGVSNITSEIHLDSISTVLADVSIPGFANVINIFPIYTAPVNKKVVIDTVYIITDVAGALPVLQFLSGTRPIILEGTYGVVENSVIGYGTCAGGTSHLSGTFGFNIMNEGETLTVENATVIAGLNYRFLVTGYYL